VHTANIFEQVALKFKSGNSVAVDRAWVTAEEFDAMQKLFVEADHQRALLLQAIGIAAYEAGIYSTPDLSGPHALMACADLLDYVDHLRSLLPEDAR